MDEMTELQKAEFKLSVIYLSAFGDQKEWTAAKHLSGLKAVFLAGANTQKKQDALPEGADTHD